MFQTGRDGFLKLREKSVIVESTNPFEVRFPFSWILKRHVDELLKTVQESFGMRCFELFSVLPTVLICLGSLDVRYAQQRFGTQSWALTLDQMIRTKLKTMTALKATSMTTSVGLLSHVLLKKEM